MKKSRFLALTGLLLLSLGCRAGVVPNRAGGVEPLEWKELAKFLAPVYGPFRAGSEPEGDVIDWGGFKSSTASRKYAGLPPSPLLEISIVDSGRNPQPEAEFNRLCSQEENSPERLVKKQKFSGHPAMSLLDHRQGKAEVVVFVAKRFLVHILVTDISREEDFQLADRICRHLDIAALAARAGG